MSSSDRIRGVSVPPLVPQHGSVHVLLIGEAPGPRGADKSGYPFFGDAAGRHLYRALARVEAVKFSADIEALPWDGATFSAAGIVPRASGIALGNAYDRCPTDDGHHFRSPSRAELEGPANVSRLANEITHLTTRGLQGILTLGRIATRTLDVVLSSMPLPALARRSVPHPSAQGLLSMAPQRGKGARMADLQEQWMTQVTLLIHELGYRPASAEPR